MTESVRESVTKAVDGGGQTTVQKWTGVIASYDREFKKWDSRVDKILKRYRDENRTAREGSAKFNVLWSNVNTLVPAVFSRLPKPDVSRRHRDTDPVGRIAALLLERALEYETEHYPDYYATIKACVYDRFLPGRGTAWVRYEPHIEAVKRAIPVDGEQVTDDIDEPDERLDYECSPVDYVHWKDFGHTVARTWDEVPQVWRWVYMRMPAKVARFGEELAKKIPTDAPPKEGRNRTEMGSDAPKEDGSLICELWDKDTKKVFWFSKSHPEMLDEKDDPLKLEEFFPCPKPLFATVTNETLVPVPDFTIYQDQARELDTLCERIDGLVNALQVKGVYDASIPELARIFTEAQNTNLIPVKNWAAFSEKNGLAGAIDLVDLKPIAEALRIAYEAMIQVKNQIYDLTGISDIIRGQSNANETATAQKLKGQYAGMRLKFMQYDVSKFAGELLQLKAQVICGQFTPEMFLRMSGAELLLDADKPYIKDALILLFGEERLRDPAAKNGPNPLRQFRIEVNADTMIELDEQAEKEARTEFIIAQATFMEKAIPMIQASPQIMPLVASLWKFSVGAFKAGKTLEGEFDAVIEKAKQMAANPQQQKPDPEMERVRSEQQIQQSRIQADQQSNQMKLQAAQAQTQAQMQADAQRDQMQMQASAQAEQAKMQAAMQIKQMEMQAESERHMRELQATAAENQRAAQLEQDTELRKTALQVAGQIEVARINADAKDKADARASQIAGVEAQTEATAAGAAADSAAQAGADTQQIMQQLLKTQSELLKTIAAPKQVMRDGNGRLIGIKMVK